MAKFKNKLTGGLMWVADDRVQEYKAAGYIPVATPAKEKPAKEPAKEPVMEPVEPVTQPVKPRIKKGKKDGYGK